MSRSARLRDRYIGAAAIAFVLLVVTENVLFALTGSLAYDARIQDVLTYYASNRLTVAIVAGLVALYLPLLLAFLAGLRSLGDRHGGKGTTWSYLALAAGATLAATFVLVNVLQIGLVMAASRLAEPTPEFEIVWQLHAAAFGMTLPALGTVSIGTALAAHASRLTPVWQLMLGLAGGSMLLAASVGNMIIAEGSALIFVGLLGFTVWLFCLLAIGIRLVWGRST